MQGKDEYWNEIQYKFEVEDDSFISLTTIYREKRSSVMLKKKFLMINL